jgi:hypothetical protein
MPDAVRDVVILALARKLRSTLNFLGEKIYRRLFIGKSQRFARSATFKKRTIRLRFGSAQPRLNRHDGKLIIGEVICKNQGP